MKIVVLAKQVPDTWTHRGLDLESGLLDRSASEQVADEINERAAEVALQYRDAHPGTEVVVLTMGLGDATTTIRKLLSMGADSAVLVSDPALSGSDAVQTARVLAAAVQKIGADLVIAGNKSTDGQGGVVPAMVAEIVGHVLAPSLDEVTIAETSVEGVMQVDGATLSIRADLPAVITLTEKVAEPRFPTFKNIMSAKKKPLLSWSLEDLGIQAGPASASVQSVMVSALERPEKQAGLKIVDDGTAATQLADFLTSNRLV